MVQLPFGGAFDEHDLLAHIHASGLDYIIQGQQTATLAGHSKPRSLDYWLRQFAANPDSKQAENSVLDALVATGLFGIVNNLICPDTSERCKGVQLLGRAT